MGKTIIHVNRQHIAMNAKDTGTRPVYTVKSGGKIRYAREVLIEGPSRLVYNGSQLKCGARAWIETEAPTTLVDDMSFAEARKKHGRETSVWELAEDFHGFVKGREFGYAEVANWLRTQHEMDETGITHYAGDVTTRALCIRKRAGS